MEWSTPTVRLSIRIKKVNTEPTLHEYRTPTPKPKLKKVSFGSTDIVKFVVMLEESPVYHKPSLRDVGIHSPIPKKHKRQQMRRFSI
jgi:hypothetical protein